MNWLFFVLLLAPFWLLCRGIYVIATERHPSIAAGGAVMSIIGFYGCVAVSVVWLVVAVTAWALP